MTPTKRKTIVKRIVTRLKYGRAISLQKGQGAKAANFKKKLAIVEWLYRP